MRNYKVDCLYRPVIRSTSAKRFLFQREKVSDLEYGLRVLDQELYSKVNRLDRAFSFIEVNKFSIINFVCNKLKDMFSRKSREDQSTFKIYWDQWRCLVNPLSNQYSRSMGISGKFQESGQHQSVFDIGCYRKRMSQSKT